MKERPCCIQHTQTDFKVILADLEISRGKMYIAIYEKKISGVAIVYQQENRLRISELFAENKEIEKALLYHIQQDKKTVKSHSSLLPRQWQTVRFGHGTYR